MSTESTPTPVVTLPYSLLTEPKKNLLLNVPDGYPTLELVSL